MQKKIFGWASVFLAAAIIVSIPSVTDAQVDPAASAPGSTFDQRLAQRKQERNISLEERDSKRSVSQCAKAQTELRRVQTEARQLSNRRDETYRSIDGKILLAVGKLKLGGVDTFKLERQRSAYIQNVDTFKEIFKEYQQALDDTVVINCGADPVGFKALLETTRIYQKQLIAQSATVRNMLVNEIKQTLTEYTNELQPKSAGDN